MCTLSPESACADCRLLASGQSGGENDGETCQRPNIHDGLSAVCDEQSVMSAVCLH